MIIENGRIEILESTEDGLDENGFPIVGEEKVVCELPCQFQQVNHSLQAKDPESGAYTRKAFSILVDMEDEPFEAERLRLFDMYGQNVGEFSVVSITPLQAVGIVRIEV